MTAYTPLPTTSSSTSQSASSSSRFNLPLPWRYPPPSSSTTNPGFDQPTLFQAITARPLRLLAWAAALILALLVVSGSFGRGPAQSHVAKIGSYASENFWASKKGSSEWRELPQNQDLLDPVMEKDPRTGFLMPPDVYPAAMNPFKRANAALVSLVRNEELDSFRDSMRSLESKFNRKFGYPWVLMNDKPFTEDFKKGVLAMTRSEVTFAQIPYEHWSYPDFVNQTKAEEEMRQMGREGVIYGDNLSYRHMCRFNSGFFYRQKVLEPYDFYWRVEPGVKFSCDIDYDPFVFMEANDKVYGFTIAIYEYERTIQTLWPTVKEFAKKYPQHIAKNNAMHFLVDNISEGLEGSKYNLCHFWSNYEIADLRFWRSQAYTDFFNFLDETGNFFYERWGDAPVHSIAAALFLPKSKVHKFEDVAYEHNPYNHCPQNVQLYHENGKCECDPARSFDPHDGYSCHNQWFRVKPVDT